VQNIDVIMHHCTAGLGRCQKCHECDIEVSVTLTEVFCGFPLFYQANAGVVPIYRPQPINSFGGLCWTGDEGGRWLLR
jgi:hypothetical protein